MKSIFADLHIHIGRTASNLPVKITAARSMTFENIIKEASDRKGMDMIGIIDAQSPPVLQEIEEGLSSGFYQEHPDGGIIYGKTTCILGTEIELRGSRGLFHVIAYFPTISHMKEASKWLAKHMKNIQLSTQRLYQDPLDFQEKVIELGGIIVPAHVFTPFKSVYGSAANSLLELFDGDRIAGVELGLSSDSDLADQLSELSAYTFVTNSDAHSLPKIAREYNKFLVKEPSFVELRKVLFRQENRKVLANYGLDPRLGKYHRTRCLMCNELIPVNYQEERCPDCGSTKWVRGVKDRISELSDQSVIHPNFRPPYYHQVPLEFYPGIGKKTIDRLLAHFGTEMAIIHQVSYEELQQVVGEKIATWIQMAREQKLSFEEGGGGVYGRMYQN